MKLGIRCWRGQDEAVVVLAGVLQSHQQFCSRLVMWSFKLAAINQSFWSRVREAVFTASDPVSSVSIPGPMGSFHSPSYHDAVSTASGWTTAFAVVFWICLVSATQFPEVQPRYWRLLRGRTTVFAVVFWICLVSVTQFPEVQPRYWRLLRGRTTVSAVVFWICLVSVTQFPEVQPRYLRLLRSRTTVSAVVFRICLVSMTQFPEVQPRYWRLLRSR